MIGALIWVEWLKLRRSRIAWLTAALVGIGAPGLTATFLAAAVHRPDSTLALKVNAVVVGVGWSAYLGMLGQIVSVSMVLGVGIVVSWCFGREFTDNTMPALFSLPAPRPMIAAAKFVVVLGWALALCIGLVAVALGLAPLLLLGAPDGLVMVGALKVLVVGVASALLALPLAFLASAARGYLAGIVGLILLVVVTQVVTVVGAGAWFPFATASIWAGMAGQEAAALVRPEQLALIPVVAVLGISCTIVWWRRAQVV